jgi:hypothetical protein
MQEHGYYSVKLEQNLLNITLVGSLNEQAAGTACQQIKASIVGLNGDKVVVLVNCLDYQGSTPQAHQISNQTLNWLNQQNCVARATVYKEKIHQDIVKHQQPEIFGMKNRREFHCFDEARQWLLAQL